MNKIEQLLKSSNFITHIELQINGITEDDVNQFCYKYDITYSYSSRIGGIFFKKNDEMVTNFKEILS